MIESIKETSIFPNAQPCFKVKLSKNVSDNFIDFLENYFDKKEIKMNANDGLEQPQTVSLQGKM